jgi:hypothetical protein
MTKKTPRLTGISEGAETDGINIHHKHSSLYNKSKTALF